MDYLSEVEAAAGFLRERLGIVPDVAIVLGSGLGDFAGSLRGATSLPYGEIPHWPASAVVGHAGTLVAGETEGRQVLALAGRVHVYEGHPMRSVTFGIRVLGDARREGRSSSPMPRAASTRRSPRAR